MATLRIVFVGVGGQGNLLASRLLGEAALQAGVPVQVSEIHGMAQRGGVVESAVVLGDALSPIISPAQADVIVGFEPAETLRALDKANRKTLVITSTSKLPPFTVAIGQGQYPEMDQVLGLLEKKVRKVIAFDALEKAVEAGNVLAVNMVLLGALAGAAKLPVSRNRIEQAIRSETKKAFLETNLKAFDLGFEAARAA